MITQLHFLPAVPKKQNSDETAVNRVFNDSKELKGLFPLVCLGWLAREEKKISTIPALRAHIVVN